MKSEHKVGIKILNDVQLNSIFPAFDHLWKKFAMYRDKAQEYLNDKKRINYQDTLLYDNIFSILGGRGTGKTSVLYTLCRKLQEEYKNDLVLPVIMPEMIPDECDILDWILALLSECISNLLKREDDREIRYGNRCQYEKTEKNLLEKLKEISKRSLSLKYNPKNGKSFSDVVSNSERQMRDAYAFAVEITEFWNQLVDFLCRLSNETNRQENQKESIPMIYIFFDDVDMAPERVNNLLSVVNKYLSHPNIITVITADEAQLQDIKMQKSPMVWKLTNAENTMENPVVLMYDEASRKKEKERAEAYLLKVLPTSTRYYLKEFHTINEKKDFYICEDATVEEKITELCKEYKDKAVNNYIQNCNYLLFFGDSSRKINNAFLIVKEYIEKFTDLKQTFRKKKKNTDGSTKKVIKDIYESTKRFMYLILDSDERFFLCLNDISEFLDKFLRKNYNPYDIYFHFRELENLYNSANGDNVISEIISLCILSEFCLIFLRSLGNLLPVRLQENSISFLLADFLNQAIFHNQPILHVQMASEKFYAHYVQLFDYMEDLEFFDLEDTRNQIRFLQCFDEKEFTLTDADIMDLYEEERKHYFAMLRMLTSEVNHLSDILAILPDRFQFFNQDIEFSVMLIMVNDIISDIKDEIMQNLFHRKKEQTMEETMEETIGIKNIENQMNTSEEIFYVEEIYRYSYRYWKQYKRTGDQTMEEEIRTYCSENVIELWERAMPLTDFSELLPEIEKLCKILRQQYEDLFGFIVVTDVDSFRDCILELADEDSAIFDMFYGIIERHTQEAEPVFPKRILQFLSGLQSRIRYYSESVNPEYQNVIRHYQNIYDGIMDSVTLCVKHEEETLKSTVQFCLNVFIYGEMLKKEAGMLQRMEILSNISDENYYYQLFQRTIKLANASDTDAWFCQDIENEIDGNIQTQFKRLN
ncbi:MAG: hypothetical protein IJ733_16565 [Lachnospiraceae bacterium]|nr:hypothetical protein [Lachnospiraceae bacterium]